MITAVDSNVLIALWNSSDTLNSRAQNALDDVAAVGTLVICGAVFAELLGYQGRTEKMVEGFLNNTEIAIDWVIDEKIWRSAAKANHGYSVRRRKHKQAEPKRLVTDFIVGAHANERGYALLTFDNRIFKAAFPRLRILKGLDDRQSPTKS